MLSFFWCDFPVFLVQCDRKREKKNTDYPHILFDKKVIFYFYLII